MAPLPYRTNPADVATRPLNKSAGSRLKSWLQGPEFISQPGDLWKETPTSFVVQQTHASYKQKPSASKGAISLLIDAAPNWYTLKKRAGYLTAFTHYIKQKTRKESFEKPKLKVNYLNKAILRVVEYVQRVCFRAATKKIKNY